jgi:hypothetical protein
MVKCRIGEFARFSSEEEEEVDVEEEVEAL